MSGPVSGAPGRDGVEGARIRAWRSAMFVPVTVDRFVEKACGIAADIIILDLEDSIAPAEKARARERVPEVAARLAGAGRTVIVRINQPLRLAVPDIEAAIGPDVAGLMLPKVDSASHLRLISELVGEIEAERGLAVGSTRYILLVETCDAFGRLREIARADPRTLALSLGAEDFAASAEARPDPDVLLYPKQQVVFEARAAGIVPLGYIGTIANFKDVEGFRQVIRQAKRFGFEGGTCIHPSLIPVLNEEFQPSAQELDQATRIVEAYDDALRRGVGAITVDGKMVDVPIVQRAQKILRRHAAVPTG